MCVLIDPVELPVESFILATISLSPHVRSAIIIGNAVHLIAEGEWREDPNQRIDRCSFRKSGSFDWPTFIHVTRFCSPTVQIATAWTTNHQYIR